MGVLRGGYLEVDKNGLVSFPVEEGDVILVGGEGFVPYPKASLYTQVFLTLKVPIGSLGLHYTYKVSANSGILIQSIDASGVVVPTDLSFVHYVIIDTEGSTLMSLGDPDAVILMAAADTGVLNQRLTNLISIVDSIGCPCLILGDNDYITDSAGSPQAHVALAPWSHLIAAQKLWPLWGNHDMNLAAGWVAQKAMFPYLPNPGKNYYHKTFGNDIIQIFFLNDGLCVRGMVEPDGNTVGSDQYDWFANEILNSTAIWKFSASHFPWVTASPQSTRTTSAIDWGFSSFGINAHLHGHAHICEFHETKGLYSVNCGGAVAGYNEAAFPVVNGNLYGVTSGANYIYANDQDGFAWRIEANSTKCRFILVNTAERKDVIYFDI